MDKSLGRVTAKIHAGGIIDRCNTAAVPDRHGQVSFRVVDRDDISRYFSATGQFAEREASCMHSISAAPSVG